MKPLKLTMHHFGPFTDETIDFTKLDKELFLITGPTGSGKTTIFDGLCYALYGEASNTHRQSKEMKSQFGDPFDMMWVDFTFGLRDRVYRVKRIPEQERKKERGEGTAKQKHEAELYDCTDGVEVLLSSSVAGVGEKVVDIMGINANQFRQIVMLPQGEFSKLLKAKEEERIELLKSIFRMELYNTLKEKVSTALKDIRKKREALKVELDTEAGHIRCGEGGELAAVLANNSHTTDYVLALTHKEIEADYTEIKTLEKSENQTAAVLEGLRITLAAGEQLNSQFEQLDKQKEKRLGLEAQKIEMTQKEERLSLSKKIKTIKPYKESWQHQKSKLEQAKKALEETKNRRDKILTDLKKSEAEYHRVMAPEYDREIETLSHKLETQKRLAEGLGAYTLKSQALAKAQISRADLEKKAERKELDEAALKKLGQDQTAVERDLLTLDKTLQSTGFAIQTLEGRQEKAEEALEIYQDIEGWQKEIVGLRAEWKILQTKIKGRQDEYEQLLAKQRTQAAAGLAKTLTDKTPCPVCGSLHHPQKAILKTDEAVSEDVLKALSKSLKTLEETSAKTKERGKYLSESIEKSRKDFKRRLEGAITTAQDTAEIDSVALKALDQQIKEETEILQTKAKNTDKQLKAKTKEKTSIAKVMAELEKQLEAYGNLSEPLKALREEESMLRGQTLQMRETLETLIAAVGFGEGLDKADWLLKKINSFNTNTAALIQEKKGYKNNTQSQYQKLKQTGAEVGADFKNETDSLTKAEKEAETLGSQFQEVLKAAGLTEESIKAFSLQAGETEESLEAGIEAYRFDLKSTIQRIDELSHGLKDKKPSDLAAYREQAQQHSQTIEAIQKRVTLLNEKIGQNQKQIKKIQALLEALEAVEQLQGIYTHLDQTIKGTLAGRPKISFERYILSAYLQDILESANIFLEKMSSGRYRLEVMGNFSQTGNRGLEIEVVDAYTGQRRSANTLSGGETFMAALSMALGLSDIVQSYAGGISLDTIFIDEGFATLDPEALDNAINCLSAIKNDGRTVGIISHVEELKDRIDTKILVKKTEAGSHIQIFE